MNLTSYSDNKLVELLDSGKTSSERAFNELYRRYSGGVHAYCLKVLCDKEKAEDIFQETFLRFIKNVKADTATTNIPGFLIKIARNLCLNEKRNLKKMVSIEDFNFYSEPNQNYEKKELLELINMALELIEFKYKEVFILKEYNELNYQEISKICDISVSNAKSRCFRAKQMIKKILEPYLNEMYKTDK